MDERDDSLAGRAREAARRLTGLRERMGELVGSTRADAWSEALEPALARIEERITRLGDEAMVRAEEADLRLQLGLLEVRERWEDVREDVEKVGDALLRGSGRALTELDMLQLHAHLAKLDAQDEIERRTDDARRRLASARSEVEQEARELLERIGESVDGLRAKLDTRPDA